MLVAFIAGLIFSFLAFKSNLFSADQVLSVGIAKNYEVLQTLFFALSISSLAFYLEYRLGAADLNIKPFYLAGVIVGGLLFGIGVGILGYCPGTLEMAIGYGRIDALFGFIGGIFAGLFYTFAYPHALPFLGPNYGAVNFYLNSKLLDPILVIGFSISLFLTGVVLQKISKGVNL